MFDIDGTLGNYHDHFYDLCVQYWSLKRRSGHWQGEQEFEDWIGISKEQYREAKLAYRQGGRKRWMPMYDGARWATQEVHRFGAEVWLATTRPWLRLDNIDPDTRWWLERNGIYFDHLLFGDADKYGRLIGLIEPERVVGVLEDLPEQFDAGTSLGLPMYQIERWHNEHQVRTPRISLVGFASKMLYQIDEWRAKYANE